MSMLINITAVILSANAIGMVLIDLFWYNQLELLQDRVTAMPKASQTPIAVILMMGKKVRIKDEQIKLIVSDSVFHNTILLFCQ